MTSIYDGTNTNSFCYDATGRRFSRTSGGTTTKFLYGPGGILLEKQGSTYTTTYTIGNALVRKDGEYPMFDGLGSERTICNSSQTVTGTAIYEGFGQTVATTGSSSNAYMFAATSGYRNDADGGLMHVGARYYDPLVGRFTARDTVPTEHPYLYCMHDPVNEIDPTGHSWKHVLGAIGFTGGVICLVTEAPLAIGGAFFLLEFPHAIDTFEEAGETLHSWVEPIDRFGWRMNKWLGFGDYNPWDTPPPAGGGFNSTPGAGGTLHWN